MGTDKRERQKANRAARIREAEQADQGAVRRRRAVTAVVAVVALLVVVGAIVALTGDDEAEVTAGDDAGSTTSTIPALPTGIDACADLASGATPISELGLPTAEALDELEIEDLVVGSGAPTPAGGTVTVNYVGFAASTGAQFDDSYQRGAPATFSLDGVIEGWSEGLVGMQPGGQRLLRIPSAMAYGETGSGPGIGPNEDLVFCVSMPETAELPATPASVPPPGPGASITGATPCPPADGSAVRTTSFAQAPPECIDPSASYTAVFATNQGTIRVELDAAAMPSTTNNFVVLSRYGYYDGTAIFRTDTSIDILQGGAPNTNSPSDPGPGYTIPDEGGEFDFSADPNGSGPFTYQPGQLVMARSAGPDSSGAQFFLTAGPKAANLDVYGTYLVFGAVTEGMEVVEQILGLHADDPTSGLGGGPSEPVIIESITIEEA